MPAAVRATTRWSTHRCWTSAPASPSISPNFTRPVRKTAGKPPTLPRRAACIGKKAWTTTVPITTAVAPRRPAALNPTKRGATRKRRRLRAFSSARAAAPCATRHVRAKRLPGCRCAWNARPAPPIRPANSSWAANLWPDRLDLLARSLRRRAPNENRCRWTGPSRVKARGGPPAPPNGLPGWGAAARRLKPNPRARARGGGAKRSRRKICPRCCWTTIRCWTTIWTSAISI